MSIRVVRPGLLTSMQDPGRFGLQQLGIVPGGAMDPVAHRIANALVGNPAAAATLECTLLGPTLLVEDDALVALYGAAFDAKADGLPLPRNRPVLIKSGTTLATGAARHGARLLAIAGGFQVPEVLGSRNTYLPAGFGGFSRRAVKAGDRLPAVADLARISAARFERLARRREIGGVAARSVAGSPRIDLPAGKDDGPRDGGPHHAQFDSASLEAFFGMRWRISPARTGWATGSRTASDSDQGGRYTVGADLPGHGPGPERRRADRADGRSPDDRRLSQDRRDRRRRHSGAGAVGARRQRALRAVHRGRS
jgi:antagonist of KipI